MGGKSSQSTQQVQIPASVLAQYQSVNAAADKTAQTPFQTYSGQFVAPVNSQQQTGIAGTNAAANEAQPYYSAATGTLGNAQAGTVGVNNAALGLTAASAGAVNATPLTGSDINQYLSPYLSDVVGSESALLNQNNQQQQSGALGTAISSGAFGGDRTGIAAANLEQQQNLANASIYSGLLNQGYNTALSTAQQQQGVNLSASQANRAALGTAGQQLASIGQTQYGEGANTASELGALGTGAQTAGLSGAAAQLQAGTVEQQTQQAQDTALYNQFEQQQSYPFQVDQFLANIAEGTGSLSGSTTTTTQPGGFFSDERLKENKKPIGKTFDGQTIYSYRLKGDPRTRIGLMAQEVQDKHPKAVGLAGAYRTVDYGKATEEAANKAHFHDGGVVPLRRALGGASLPYSNEGGLDIPDEMNQHQLQTAPALQKSPSGLQEAVSLGSGIANIANTAMDIFSRGGLARRGYDDGGDVTPDASVDPDMLPEVDVTATRPDPIVANTGLSGAASPDRDAGVVPAMPAAAPDAPKGVAAAAASAPTGGADGGDFDKHWYQKASNVIPLLQGIAAMGTAPTKHLGVALAAGLGAGAGSYVPTQEGLAKAGLTQQEAAGKGIDNQLAQQKLKYLTTPPPTVPSAGGTAPQVAPNAPLSEQLRSKYAPPPILPQESSDLQYAHRQAVALNSDQPVKAVQDKINNRIQAQTFAARQDAQQHYDDAYAVATNPSTPPDIAAAARSAASAYQQWTGDDFTPKEGVIYNSRTQKPPIGDEAQRISPSAYIDRMTYLNEKVTVPTGVPGESIQIPRYEQMGYKKPIDAFAAQAPSGVPGVTPPAAGPQGVVVGAPQVPPSGASPRAVAPPRAPRTPAAATLPTGGATAGASGATPAVPPRAPAAAPAAPPADPATAAAFADPKYRLPPQRTRLGLTPGREADKQADATAEKRKELNDDAEVTVKNASTALQYATAAKAILESQGKPVTGPLGGLVAKVTAPFGSVDATNYEVMAKMLGNLAAQSAPQNFPHATEKETLIQHDQLSPNVAQTPDAIRDLINNTISQNKYALDSANRVTDYLRQSGPNPYNGNPQDFWRWNQEHFPRAETVNSAYPNAPAIGTVRGKFTYVGGDPMDKRNWVSK